MIVVDRIEGELAVLEVDGQRVDFPLSGLPPGCREGDVLRFVLDPEARAERLRDAQERLDRLAARDPGGDIEL